jgi:hypothetical protein
MSDWRFNLLLEALAKSGDPKLSRIAFDVTRAIALQEAEDERNHLAAMDAISDPWGNS